MERLVGRRRASRPTSAGSTLLAPAPPAVPAGHRTGPPGFVGVGVMKAGTSWWYRLVVDHPGAVDVAGRPKEVHFFDRFVGEPFGDADVDRYHRYFPRPGGAQVGEWTPRYLHDHWVAPLLARAAPEALLLVVLRDPVERFVSGLAHDTDRGAALTPTLSDDHFARGLYHVQLERLFDHVDRERVLVLQYERCVADPAAELARTYRFLGLDDAHRPAALGDRVNDTRVAKPTLDPDRVEALGRAYRPDVARLVQLVPDLDVALWPAAAQPTSSA